MPVDLNALIEQAASKYGVPVRIAQNLATAESAMNPNAVSPAGAVGVMQLMPSTAKALGVDPYDPAQNVEGGIRYLKQMYDRFGSWPLAVAAYNAGPGAVEKHGGIPPYPETRGLVAKVLGETQAQPVTRQPDRERLLRQLIRTSELPYTPYTSNWVDAFRNAVRVIRALREPTVWERLPEGMKTIAKLQQEETARHQQAMEDIYLKQADAAKNAPPSTTGERIARAEAIALETLLKSYDKRIEDATSTGKPFNVPGIVGDTIKGYLNDPVYAIYELGSGLDNYNVINNFVRLKLGLSLDDYVEQLKKAEEAKRKPTVDWLTGEIVAVEVPEDPLVQLLEPIVKMHNAKLAQQYGNLALQ